MRLIARLVVVGGGGVLFLRNGRYLLGRGSECDLVLGGDLASRRHAVLEVADGTAVVADQGSRNGTRVDGRRVQRAGLAHGSVVRIGAATCVFEWLDRREFDDDDPTPAAEGDREPAVTAAEWRVLTLLLGGHAEKAIAGRLKISPHTVHNHVKKIYLAYGVNSRPELLALFVGRPAPPGARPDGA